MFLSAGFQVLKTNDFREGISICQICYKQGHTADACCHIYDDTYLPSSKSFGNGQMFGPKTSYMATFQPFSSYQSSFEDYYDIHNSNHYSLVIYLLEPFIDVVPEAHVVDFEGPTDESWYLDSGATHHLTNNMANMNV